MYNNSVIDFFFPLAQTGTRRLMALLLQKTKSRPT